MSAFPALRFGQRQNLTTPSPMAPSVPAVQGGRSPVEDLLSNQAGAGMSYADMVKNAQAQGGRLNGQGSVTVGWSPSTIATSGHPITRDLNSYGGTGVSSPQNVLNAALLDDTSKMQGAADRQFARNQGQIDSYSQFLSGMGPMVRGQGDELNAQLAGVAGEAQGLGQAQYADWMKMAGGVMDKANSGIDAFTQGATRIQDDVRGHMAGLGDVTNDINESYRLGDEAVAEFAKAVSDYSDRTAKDASVVAAGIRHNSKTMMRQARSGVNPDGTPMTPGQQAESQASIQFDTQQQVQSAITPIFSDFNKTMASLNQVLASLRMGNAGLRQSGAQIKLGAAQTGLQGDALISDLEKSKLGAEEARAQIGTTLTGQQIAAGDAQRSMMSLRASLAQSGAQLTQAAMFQSINLEMQGRTQIAQLVQQNPESVVSWFQSLLALYSTQMAQSGGGGAPNPSAMGGGPQRSSTGLTGSGGNSGSQFGSMNPTNTGADVNRFNRMPSYGEPGGAAGPPSSLA